MTTLDDLGGEESAPGEPDGPRGGSHLARYVALAVGIVLVALIALLATGKNNSERPASAKIVGQAVPVVAGETLDGSTYDIDLHRGNWVVVNFFASWCTPCRIEQPELVRFAAEHATAGDVEIVGVTFQDTPDKVQEFFAEQGGEWPVLVGDTGSIALDFGVTGVPESYIVSPCGQVVAKFEGVTALALDEVIADYSTTNLAASCAPGVAAP